LLIKDAIPVDHPYYQYVGLIENRIHLAGSGQCLNWVAS
jgi:hypothetical protein